tara:strand:- start:1696 stop:2133 length:438 start_codon:yes stop_codon:yes gene_type:complete
MNNKRQILKTYINYFQTLFHLKTFSFLLLFLLGSLFIPTKQAESKEIFLQCTGKYEVNRGALIKPDWEISFIKINLDGLKSSIDDKGIKKEGKTLIRRNSYTITHRDNTNRIKTRYRINGTYGTYTVDYPQSNKTLIGTCQKSLG